VRRYGVFLFERLEAVAAGKGVEDDRDRRPRAANHWFPVTNLWIDDNVIVHGDLGASCAILLLFEDPRHGEEILYRCSQHLTIQPGGISPLSCPLPTQHYIGKDIRQHLGRVEPCGRGKRICWGERGSWVAPPLRPRRRRRFNPLQLPLLSR